MPGRSYIGPSGYRYGFGTQEKDDEIYGAGNSYTAEYWEYDPRLGRRWNIDPIIKPWESPYTTFSNNPILFNDPSGLNSDKPKPNEKGHVYDCGDGTSEVFDGEKYVPNKTTNKSYNLLIIHDQQFPGNGWKVEQMERDNENWAVVTTKNITAVTNFMEGYVSKTGNKPSNIFLMSHSQGPGTIMIRSVDGFGQSIDANSIYNYLDNGTTGSSDADSYIKNLQKLASLLLPGGNFCFGACRAGLSEEGKKSFATGLALSLSKSNNNFNLFLHNDKTTFYKSEQGSSIHFGEGLTDDSDFINGWTKIKIFKSGEVSKKIIINADLQLNKTGTPITPAINSTQLNK